MTLTTLKRRSEFLAVRGGARWGTPAFLLEGRARFSKTTSKVRSSDAVPTAARFGFTVTKKLGGAVERNRMRRRLREAVRLAGPELAKDGWDYVLVARPAASAIDFEVLVGLVREALARVAKGGSRPAGKSGERRPQDQLSGKLAGSVSNAPNPASRDGRAKRDP